MNAKDILKKIKAAFEAPIVPAAAAAPVVPTPTVFKLKDGTEVGILIDDPAVSTAPDAGDIVTIAGVPAPAADYELEDGTKITVDATGAITLVVAPTPVTQPDFTAPVAKTLEERIAAIEAKISVPASMSAAGEPFILTAEVVAGMYAKFATGTPEERLANIEIMIKALMECNFGYEIRKGQDAAAIQVYKDTLTPMQTAVASQTQALQAADQKITKQDETIKGLFELVEKLVDEPMTDPGTLTGQKKDQFDRMTAKEERLQKLADAMKKLKVLN